MIKSHKLSPGMKIPVQLPGELVRGEVVDVLSDNEVSVCINQHVPMSRTHSYQLGDTVLCTKVQGLGGLDKWEAVKTA